MISSPCKKCPKIDQPKDQCTKDCPLIQKLQGMAVDEANLVSTAIDYADDVRFSIPAALTRFHITL